MSAKIEQIKAMIERAGKTNLLQKEKVDLDKERVQLEDAIRGSYPTTQDGIDFEQELYKRFGMVKDFTLGMRIAQAFYDLGCSRTAERYDEIEYNRQRAAEEETTRKEFVEELDRYFFGCTSSITMPECYKACEHFAQWGAERQKEQDDRLVDIIYQQGIEEGKDEIRETLKRKEEK